MLALVSSVSVTSDAFDPWDYGPYMQSGDWFQLEWPAEWLNVNIAARELVPIIVAAAFWGKCWNGHHILFQSDNEAVVWSINKTLQRTLHYCMFLDVFFSWQLQRCPWSMVN